MNETLTLKGSVALEAAADKKPRRLTIVAYSGDVMTVDGFGPVVVSLAGVDIPTSVPVLTDHENRIDAIVASGTASVNGGRLVVNAQLADSEAARQVVALVASGVSLQASIGARPTKRVYVPAGQAVLVNGKTVTAPDRGLTVIETSELREVSVVAVAADPSTTVSISAAFSSLSPSLKGQSLMNETSNVNHLDADAIRRQERERIREIEAAVAGLDQPEILTAKHKAIDGDISLGELRSIALQQLRAGRPAPGIHFGGRNVAAGPAVLESAFLTRVGRADLACKEYGEHAVETADRIADKSFIGLARMACELSGTDPAGKDAGQLLRASGPSTYNLPVAISNVMGKILWQAYNEAPASWKGFAKIASAPDFRQQTGVRPTAFPNLEEVPGGGEVKHGTISEGSYTWQISQYAKQLQIDRKTLINDDLGFLDDLAPLMAQSAMRTLSDLVWTTILDGIGTFFASGNANVLTTSSALSVTTLGQGIAKMRNQRDAAGNDLDLSPAVLITTNELEAAARQILDAEHVGNSNGEVLGNPVRNVVRLAVEGRLSNATKYPDTYSATQWLLFGPPMSAPVIVGYLNGQQSPMVETFDMGIDRLGIGMRCVFDFGVALGDYRAAVHATGAA